MSEDDKLIVASASKNGRFFFHSFFETERLSDISGMCGWLKKIEERVRELLNVECDQLPDQFLVVRAVLKHSNLQIEVACRYPKTLDIFR